MRNHVNRASYIYASRNGTIGQGEGADWIRAALDGGKTPIAQKYSIAGVEYRLRGGIRENHSRRGPGEKDSLWQIFQVLGRCCRAETTESLKHEAITHSLPGVNELTRRSVFHGALMGLKKTGRVEQTGAGGWRIVRKTAQQHVGGNLGAA